MIIVRNVYGVWVMSDFDANEAFQVADYNANWPLMFEAEAGLVADALGDHVVEIEHVGSTSVPGLCAKPIIDLLVAVEEFWPVEAYMNTLGPLGYTYQSQEADDDRKFLWKGVPRTHHMHIVEYATWEHQRHIIFRDYLRSKPEIARDYENVKRELAVVFKSDRPAYTRGKTAFIKSIMARAVEEILDPNLRKLLARHPDEDHFE